MTYLLIAICAWCLWAIALALWRHYDRRDRGDDHAR